MCNQLTMTKFLLILIIFGLLTSCNYPLTNNKILTQADNFKIEVLIPDIVKKNDTIYTPLILKNNNYKLREAFIEYNITDTTLVDTSKFILVNRGAHLLIKNDTAQYWIYTSSNTGHFNSGDITLIAKGPGQKLFYQTFSFDYIIK